MFKSNIKKFNTIIVLFFLYVSLENLTKFNDDNIEMPAQDYEVNQIVEKKDNLIIDNLETSQLETEINESLKKRFNLVKKTQNSNPSSKNIAYYSDTDVATDYVYDQDDVNLNLVPVFETILL